MLSAVSVDQLTEHVSYQLDGGVATVTLTRPEARNALSPEMGKGLAAAVARIEEDRRVRAVVLTGEGSWFCAGGDLKGFAEHGLGVVDGGLVHRALIGLHRLPAPVIAGIAGGAFGFGLGLACACDIRIAEAEARFAAGFTGIGLSPDSTTSYFLPRLVGPSRARAMMLTNIPIMGREAKEFGLVWSLAEPGKVLEEATLLAQRVAALPSAALARAKVLLEASWLNSIEQQVDVEVANIVQTSETADFREGVTAFVERRTPRFDATRGA